jgi:septum formation protein
MEKLLLASSSPRRRELLESLDIAFDVWAPDIDESRRDYLPPAERVVSLASDKAWAAARSIDAPQHRLVLGADTLVCIEDPGAAPRILGKPSDGAEARAMLEVLQGRTHVVYTGIALIDRISGGLRSACSSTSVSFAPMEEGEIIEYIDSGDWTGAAGGYKIQGRAALYITQISGSWSGVVGLPLRELYGILREAEFRFSA